jgi:hypothetical protein
MGMGNRERLQSVRIETPKGSALLCRIEIGIILFYIWTLKGEPRASRRNNNARIYYTPH